MEREKQFDGTRIRFISGSGKSALDCLTQVRRDLQLFPYFYLHFV